MKHKMKKAEHAVKKEAKHMDEKEDRKLFGKMMAEHHEKLSHHHKELAKAMKKHHKKK